MIGKGNIGGSLGSKWRAAGHDVVYVARDGSGEGPGGAPVPAFVGDAGATATIDALFPLWFALVQQNGGNRRLALRMVTEG